MGGRRPVVLMVEARCHYAWFVEMTRRSVVGFKRRMQPTKAKACVDLDKRSRLGLPHRSPF
jgi:hypothetical protein